MSTNIKKNTIVMLFYIGIVCLVMGPLTNDLAYGDDIFYMGNSVWVAKNNLNPWVGGNENTHNKISKDEDSLSTIINRDVLFLDGMHPPLLFFLVGLLYSLFGIKVIVHKILFLFLSAITLYFIYKIGSHIYTKKVGFIASILILFLPLYLAQTGLFNLAIPTSALLSASLFYLVSKKKIPFLIASTLLFLTNEFTIIIYPLFIIFIFFENDKLTLAEKIKKNTIYLVPLIFFFLWMYFHYLEFGWFLFTRRIPESFEIITIISLLYEKAGAILLKDLMWLHVFIITIGSIYYNKKIHIKRNLSIILALLLLSYCLLSGWEKSSIALFYISLLLLIWGSRKEIKEFYKKENRKFTFLVFSLLAISFVTITIIDFFYRYLLPFTILVMIPSANHLWRLFNKYSYIIVTAITILLISMHFYTTPYQLQTEEFTEDNMQYLAVTNLYKESVDYINENHPNKTTVTSFHPYFIFKYPYLGYTKKPLKVVWAGDLNNKNFDLIFFSNLGGTPTGAEELEFILNKNNIKLIKEFSEISKNNHTYFVKIYKMNPDIVDLTSK